MENLYYYWNSIPIGSKNAVTYAELMLKWNMSERGVRMILHKLSYFDNGDPYILIRTSKRKGFYKTDNIQDIECYKKECINRARHTFAPIKKINRILQHDDSQLDLFFHNDANGS